MVIFILNGYFLYNPLFIYSYIKQLLKNILHGSSLLKKFYGFCVPKDEHDVYSKCQFEIN